MSEPCKRWVVSARFESVEKKHGKHSYNNLLMAD